jgi:hypothetical protein
MQDPEHPEEEAEANEQGEDVEQVESGESQGTGDRRTEVERAQEREEHAQEG